MIDDPKTPNANPLANELDKLIADLEAVAINHLEREFRFLLGEEPSRVSEVFRSSPEYVDLLLTVTLSPEPGDARRVRKAGNAIGVSDDEILNDIRVAFRVTRALQLVGPLMESQSDLYRFGLLLQVLLQESNHLTIHAPPVQDLAAWPAGAIGIRRPEAYKDRRKAP